MSRYTKLRGDKIYVYGYDTPTRSMFFACYDATKGQHTGPDNCIFNVGPYSIKAHPDKPHLTNYSAEQLLELMKSSDGVVDPDHLKAAHLGRPF